MLKNEPVFSFRPTGHGDKVESKILTALQDQRIKGECEQFASCIH